jgi:hypothetical protein
MLSERGEAAAQACARLCYGDARVCPAISINIATGMCRMLGRNNITDQMVLNM